MSLVSGSVNLLADSTIEEINIRDKGTLNTEIEQEPYLLSFLRIQELDQVYVIAVRETDYLKELGEQELLIVEVKEIAEELYQISSHLNEQFILLILLNK